MFDRLAKLGLPTVLVTLAMLVPPTEAFIAPTEHLAFGWGFGFDGTQDLAIIAVLAVWFAITVFWMPFADFGSFGDYAAMTREANDQIRAGLRTRYGRLSYVIAPPAWVVGIIRLLFQIFGIVALAGYALSNYIVKDGNQGTNNPTILATPHHSFYMVIIWVVVAGARIDLFVQTVYSRWSSLLWAFIFSLVELVIWLVAVLFIILEIIDNGNENPAVVIDWQIVIVVAAGLYFLWSIIEAIRYGLTWWNNGPTGLYNIGANMGLMSPKYQ
jgi:hypothetical protein